MSLKSSLILLLFMFFFCYKNTTSYKNIQKSKESLFFYKLRDFISNTRSEQSIRCYLHDRRDKAPIH